MSSPLTFASRTFPSRVADLGFTVDLPADWNAQDLPPDSTDFSDPTAFHPLAVVTAPHAVLIFAVGARPAYENGTLHDWTWFLLKHNELQPRAVGRGQVAGVPAVIGEATKPSDFGPMVVRFAFFEDGGRLVHLTFAAPELLADAVHEAWSQFIRTFRLETPRGSRFPNEPHPDDQPAAPIPEPWMEQMPADSGIVAAPSDADRSPDPSEQSETSGTPRAPHPTSPATPVPAVVNPLPIAIDAPAPVNPDSVASQPEPPLPRMPVWWKRALELEAQDQLEAAENTIRANCPHIGFAASTAEMYRRRMNRLKAAGDRAGALDAFKRSSEFIFFYASMATSGGEGAALSHERDQFRAQLVAEYGGDPEARCA